MQNVTYQIKRSFDDSWHMDRPHFHEDVEVLLCLSDGGNFFIDNKLYPIKSGALFLINEAVLHRSTANNSYERYILHTPPSVLSNLSTPKTSFKAFLKKTCLNINLDEQAALKLKEMFSDVENFKEENFGSDIRRAMCFASLLLEIFANFDKNAVSPIAEGNPDFERVSAILKFINNHLSETLTLDLIAQNFFINKYHLCHIFKNATGFSVMEYIIHLRVLKARELLRTGMRVQEVSEAVGFQNNQHFIRTFGNLTGVSPKKYANEYLLGYKE